MREGAHVVVAGEAELLAGGDGPAVAVDREDFAVVVGQIDDDASGCAVGRNGGDALGDGVVLGALASGGSGELEGIAEALVVRGIEVALEEFVNEAVLEFGGIEGVGGAECRWSGGGKRGERLAFDREK
jgi:hypothetical protein